MKWLISVLPAFFLFVLGNIFFCRYFLVVLIGVAVLILIFARMLQKKKEWRPFGLMLFLTGIAFCQVVFGYAMSDRCWSKAPGMQNKIVVAETMKALEFFHEDCGFFPTTEQGLTALVERPQAPPLCDKWGKAREEFSPYMKHPAKDYWGHELLYRNDGKPTVLSLGKDGALGGEGADKDISSEDFE